MTERLALRSLTKLYGPVPAVKDITFSVRPGVVHALIGENGAGKSTLVRLITGMEPPDSGEILLDGVPCTFSTPIEARRAGVTAVYQNPKLFPHLDVAENIFMGIYPRNALGLVDKRRMYAEASRMLREVGVDIDPRSYLSQRSIAEVHFVEIVRAMCANLRLLLLDEPTATLTPAEADEFFSIMRSLTSRGVSVIFISHRLKEVRRIADDITILRDSEHIVTARAAELSEDDIVHHMVGRDVATLYTRSIAPVTEQPLLEVRGLGLSGHFEDVSFSIRGGEIVGLAGLVGAGRTEIAEAIFGIRPPEKGTVVVDGVETRPRSPEEMAGLGVAYLPENRDAHGLATSMAVTSNICMAALDRLSPDGLIRHSSETAFAQGYASDFEIIYQSLDAPVETLSGGNRQKVALAKWLAALPKVLMLDEPTQGIDISTRTLVHQRIAEIASAGYPILLISSDVNELLAMCDRILVVAGGRIVARFDRTDATQDRIMGAAVTGRSRGTGGWFHVDRGEIHDG
ncbi:MAG TPA: sugar ABC transporter ATP-binding protein [Spirochaetia bacterium]